MKITAINIRLSPGMANSITCAVAGHDHQPLGEPFEVSAWNKGVRRNAIFTKTKCSHCEELGKTQIGWSDADDDQGIN